jgi:hypothetical protein
MRFAIWGLTILFMIFVVSFLDWKDDALTTKIEKIKLSLVELKVIDNLCTRWPKINDKYHIKNRLTKEECIAEVTGNRQ